jgi:hypothetical protein
MLRLCLISILLSTTTVNADTFGILSRHEDLKAHVVLDAGDFEKVEQPSDSFKKVVSLHSGCFEISIAPRSYGKTAGLALSDRS